MAICFCFTLQKAIAWMSLTRVPLSVMKIKRWFFLLVAALMALVGYALLVEPNRLVVRRVVIKDSVLAQAWPGLAIVHLSDTHIRQMGAKEGRLLAAINDLNPELIVMSGDFNQWQADPGPVQQFLAQLSAPLGVFGVLGDADQVVNGPKGCAFCHPVGRYHQRLARPVILRNEVRSMAYRSGTITIAGVEWAEEGSGEWLRQLSASSGRSQEPLLVLSHSSQRWTDTPLAGHSLWLSGDTHGGQVWMPDWLWKMISYKPDPRHMGGVYDNGQGGWLIVNRGIGTTARFPFRFGVPPELLVITFAESDGGMGR